MNRRRSSAAVRDSLMLLLTVWAIVAMLITALLVADEYAASEYRKNTRERLMSPRAGATKNDPSTAGTAYPVVVPCDTDADCHAKNPGLCREEEPYCFPR